MYLFQFYAVELSTYATILHRYMTPANLIVGEDLTIRDLVETVCDVVGFEGEWVFDTSKPDGTPRKWLSADRFANWVGVPRPACVMVSLTPFAGTLNRVA